MSYTINKFNGQELVVLEDGTIDTSTSIGLVGRNYVGYGETQNENFVFLLENFANDAPPSRPIQGQTWFNSSNSLLSVYTGTTWVVVGAAILSATAPEEPTNGALWLDSDLNTLSIWNGTSWDFIGPEIAEGFGTTRAKSTTLLGDDNNRHPVILLTVDNRVIAICTSTAFTIAQTESIDGFIDLVSGITLSSLQTIKGNIIGNASTANRLETLRTINGIGFDGTTNITIQASTSNPLIRGDYLIGSSFNGSSQSTWSVDATSANVIGKVVVRNSQGGFAASTVTANLVGNVTGNVTATTGTSVFNTIQATEVIGPVIRGNASSATRLETGRNINGVYFDGTTNVTVTAAAETLTGTALSGSVLESSLTSVGTLTSLVVAAAGVEIDGNVKLFANTGGVPTLSSLASNKKLQFTIVDTRRPGNTTDISFIPSSDALSLGGEDKPALVPTTGAVTNLGHPASSWNNIYASNLIGNANTATLATSATNIAGGAAGSVPYQTATGITALLPIGVAGQVLTAGAAGTLSWKPIGDEGLSAGTHLSLANTLSGSPLSLYTPINPTTISIDATSANTAGTVVSRDGSGNFSASMITSGVTLLANPTSAMHATPKQYVDSVATLPTGMINLWYGSIVSIPGGWALCDGSNGTPDLRNRFIVGAGSTYTPGATGGSANAITVAHTHSITDPAHTHALVEISGGPWAGTPQGVSQNASGTDGNLDGSVRITGYDRSSVGLSIATATTGISVNSSGSSGTNANLPPYYALCYIMKL